MNLILFAIVVSRYLDYVTISNDICYLIEIWGSHSGEDIDVNLPGCNSM
jgi:hypothetical protein